SPSGPTNSGGYFQSFPGAVDAPGYQDYNKPTVPHNPQYDSTRYIPPVPSGQRGNSYGSASGQRGNSYGNANGQRGNSYGNASGQRGYASSASNYNRDGRGGSFQRGTRGGNNTYSGASST